MGKDFQVSYIEYHKEKDNFNCYHCRKDFRNKKSFMWYGCVPDCAYNEKYGSKKLKKAKETNLIENQRIIQKEPHSHSNFK